MAEGWGREGKVNRYSGQGLGRKQGQTGKEGKQVGASEGVQSLHSS